MRTPPRLAPLYCLLAGSCDGLTGLMLLTAPLFTLKLMGITPLPAEPIYMRWIGAFVFSVGSSYALPFLSTDPRTHHRRLMGVLELTAWIRICIGLFVAVGVVTQGLASGWTSVALTDGTLATVQLWLASRLSRDVSP